MLALATAALTLAAIEGAQPTGAEPSADQRDVQLCEFRRTEIILNSLGGPAARLVSEQELAWARDQEQRAERGEPCEPSPGLVDAAAHNTAFEAGTQWGLTPQTTDERLLCAAVWNRWNYALESAADPLFVSALRPELSAANAAARRVPLARRSRASAGQFGGRRKAGQGKVKGGRKGRRTLRSLCQ